MTSQALEHLSRADPVMRRLIRQIGPCTLEPAGRTAPYQMLICSVAHQQLNGTAANTILRRFRALFPGRRFPRPEDVLAAEGAALRRVGFSQAKVAALRDISAKTLSGVVPGSRQIARMTDEAIIDRLTQVRGVGRWTAEMVLMFNLGRPDVLPADDFGVRNGFRIAYGLRDLPQPREVLARGECWRPYRTTASWYLWRAVDRERQRQRQA